MVRLLPGSSDVLGVSYFFSSLKPASPYGRSLLGGLAPYAPGDEEKLVAELDLVGIFVSLLADKASEARLAKVRHYLTETPDWREQLGTVSAGGELSDAELFTLKQNLYFFAAIRAILRDEPALVADFSPPDLSLLWALLDPEGTGSPSFYLADAYSAPLAEIRSHLREERKNATRLARLLNEQAVAAVSRHFNLAGEITVPRREREEVAKVEMSGLFELSRETYTDLYYVRKATAEEVAKAAHLEDLQRIEHEEEEKVRAELAQNIRPLLPLFDVAIARLARLDLTLSKALLARRWQATKPDILPRIEPAYFRMCEARHPEVAEILSTEGRHFAPIDIELTSEVAIITGANMGGKTVALRTIGLLATLAAYGMYVPAKGCRTSLFSAITMLSGEYRPGVSGLSRFGQEIVGLCKSLPGESDRVLLLIDEFASSTNPREGSALAEALVEHLLVGQSISVITTHYESLARQAQVAHWQVVGLSLVSSEELSIALAAAGSEAIGALGRLMDYRLFRVEPSEAHSRDALRVARFLGLQEGIVERAAALLRQRGAMSDG